MPNEPRKRWSRREALLALNLYFETPFGKQDKSYLPIVELAATIGRTPSSVAMKLSNFTSLDPAELERGIKGLSGASQLDKDIWNEFHQNGDEVVIEIESLLDDLRPSHRDVNLPKPVAETKPDERSTESVSLVKQRRHQSFFRRVVLRSHGERCCVTGNPVPQLLRASHIVPWAESPEQRLNPRNGLCLAATFDEAFDRGLIGFDENFQLLVSDRLKGYANNSRIQSEFIRREGQAMTMPEKNLPDASLLRWHRETLFARQQDS